MGGSWWLYPRWAEEYQKGVDQYMERMFTTEAQREEIRCPCRLCHFRNWFHKSVVKKHMIAKGIVELPEQEKSVVKKHMIAKGIVELPEQEKVEVEQIEMMYLGELHFDNMINDLLNDTFRDGTNRDAEVFYNLVKEGPDESTGKVRRISAKILRYFPIKKRIQRLFLSPKTANQMTWHAKQCPRDGLLRHPADGEDWKKFDLLYPKFAENPRNVRLALTSDGFNPFSTMSTVYSTWPVILTNYNLPPWLCTKSVFLMLALLIPGPSSPGNAIDVYMQPLVKDLKELWDIRIETYDSSRKQVFNLHAIRESLHAHVATIKHALND